MDYNTDYNETNEINARENEMAQNATLMLQTLRQQQQLQHLQSPLGIGRFNFRVPDVYQPQQQPFNKPQKQLSVVNNTRNVPIPSAISSTSTINNRNILVLPSASASSAEQVRLSPRTPPINSSSVNDASSSNGHNEIEDEASTASPDLLSRLVDAIVKFPVLWNTQLRCYKKEEMKEEAWKKLAAELGETDAKIKYEWSKLRENFRKCLKKRELKTRSGSGNEKLPSCHFFNELQFLTDTLLNKETDSNIENCTPKRKLAATVENHIPQSTDDVSDVSVEGSQQISLTPIQRKKNKLPSDNSQISMLDAALVETLNKVNGKNSNRNDEKDADTLFCLSLVDTLKSLTVQKNSLVKLKIQQLLYEVQFDQNN